MSTSLPTIPCSQCEGILTLGVQRSAAGYFLGYRCDGCGPHGRVSAYTSDLAKAQATLEQTRDPLKWASWETWADNHLPITR